LHHTVAKRNGQYLLPFGNWWHMPQALVPSSPVLKKKKAPADAGAEGRGALAVGRDERVIRGLNGRIRSAATVAISATDIIGRASASRVACGTACNAMCGNGGIEYHLCVLTGGHGIFLRLVGPSVAPDG
jgi:hypothetical protein